jgi:uncharacterized protein YbaP (TraB family)
MRSFTRTILGLVLCLIGSSCSSTLKHPFFWQIEKDGKTSYILGSQHQGIRYSEIPDYVYEKLDSSSLVVTESSTREERNVEPKTMEELRQYAKEHPFTFWQTGDKTLENQLSAATWKLLVKKYAKANAGTVLNLLSPLGATGVIAPKDKVLIDRWTYASWFNDWSIDRYVQSRASEKGKRQEYLDTEETEEWLRVCMNELAIQTIEGWANGKPVRIPSREYYESDDYRSGDDEQIRKMIGDIPDLEYQCMFTKRNNYWLAEIEKVHEQSSPVFFTFGVGHMLIGKDALPGLLEARGFKVKRVEQTE